MPKSAAEVMQDVLVDAIVEAVEALRAGAGGLPNNLLRDIQGIHRNAAFADLPKPLQDSVGQSVRAAFNQLLREGYAVGPKAEVQSRPPLDRVPERDRRTPADRRQVRNGAGRRGPGKGPRPGGGPPRPRNPKG